MKQLLAAVAVSALLATAGCDHGTTGGPGAKDKDRGPHAVQPEDSFKLSTPMTGTTLKQGEKADVKIGISRGKNFDQDVKVSFGNVPQGVTITPAHPTLKASEKEIDVTVEAGKDAAVGDHTINVEGKPAREGPEGTGTIKVTVKKP
jgi:uncharacterized membrane protein